MPWDAKSFAAHNKGLSAPQSAHAARIANAVLKRTGDEGESIAVANKYFQKRDYGGGVSDTPEASPAGTSGSDTPGVMPSTATQNPLVRGMAQRYATMSPEQLQELSVRMQGTPQGQMIQTMLARKRMMPQAQGLAPGGLLSGASPATRAEEDAGTTSFGGANGYLHGPTPGRADQIMTSAPAGSHVIPADVIGGLGDGNSTAGAGLMTHMLRTGPWGVPMPPGGGRRTMPSPPRPPAQQARGGATDEQRPVALSHGEFVITPEQVAAIGDGDMQRGHKIIDQWIVEMRKMIIAQMSKLPRPVGMKK